MDMTEKYIYMVVVNNIVYPEFGYFDNFDLAKAKAAKIAAEFSKEESVEEYSWKAHELFNVNDQIIGVVKVDHFTCAEY